MIHSVGHRDIVSEKDNYLVVLLITGCGLYVDIDILQALRAICCAITNNDLFRQTTF